jgi:hypothetical protein
MQVKTQKLLLCSGNQVNDNMFRPVYLFQLGHHQVKTLVTKEEFCNAYSIYKCNMDVNEIWFLSHKHTGVCAYIQPLPVKF